MTEQSHRAGAGPLVSERREHDRLGARETLSCRRRVGDRSRTVTKERDGRDERTLDTIEGMDAAPDDLDRFDDDFQRMRGGGRNMLGFDQHRYPQQRGYPPQQRAPPPRSRAPPPQSRAPRQIERGYDLDRDVVEFECQDELPRSSRGPRRW